MTFLSTTTSSHNSQENRKDQEIKREKGHQDTSQASALEFLPCGNDSNETFMLLQSMLSQVQGIFGDIPTCQACMGQFRSAKVRPGGHLLNLCLRIDQGAIFGNIPSCWACMDQFWPENAGPKDLLPNLRLRIDIRGSSAAFPGATAGCHLTLHLVNERARVGTCKWCKYNTGESILSACKHWPLGTVCRQ